MTGLQTGLVEALGAPPQVAVIAQYFNHAPNMTQLRWQLLLGATIISKSTWEKIPADIRPALLQAARESGTRLQAEIRGSEGRDIEAMKKRGLNVVAVSPQQMLEWQTVTAQLYPRIRGPIVPTRRLHEANALPRRVSQGQPAQTLMLVLRRAEETALVAALALATLLPLVDIIGRPLGGFHVPGSASYVQQLTLWLAFVGGLLATRENKHLTLSTAELLGEGRARRLTRLWPFSVSAAVVAVLAYASIELIRANREQGRLLPIGLPEWVSECIMPLALGAMALRFAWGASDGWRGRLIAVLTIAATFALGLVPAQAPNLVWPLAIGHPGRRAARRAGVRGHGRPGAAAFFTDGTPIGAVSAEVYAASRRPTLPAIPLLTLAGYVLAAGGASERLVRASSRCSAGCRAASRLMAISVCALFTTFTGGSGVTIMALGGLVLPDARQGTVPRRLLARPGDRVG